MNDNIESTGRGTGNSWATRRPRTLEQLLDREEALAKQGVVGQAELLGEDALDLLNLPYHFKRKPLGTSAALLAAGLFLAARFRPSKDGRRPRGRRPGGVLEFAEGLIGSTVASAFTGGIGPLARLGRYASRKTWSP